MAEAPRKADVAAVEPEEVHVAVAAAGEDAELGMPRGALAAAVAFGFDFELGAGFEDRRLLGAERAGEECQCKDHKASHVISSE